MKPLVVVALVAALAGCGCRAPQPAPAARPAEHADEAKEAKEHAEESGKLIRIAGDMLRDLRITTGVVESRSAAEGSPVLGELRVDEDRYAEVSSPIAAQALNVLAAPGDRVRGGQPLLEASSLELGKARGAHREAEARRLLASQTLERKRGLAAERIAPQREVQEAEAELLGAQASLAAARATLETLGASTGAGDGRFELKAPVAGVVLERNVVRGQVVEPGRALFKVGDLRQLWLIAHASERDAVRVRPGSPARVSIPALPGASFEAKVALVGRQVDSASRTIPVRLVLANQDEQLRLGMSATVWLRVGEGEQLLAVPAAALQRLHDSWSVFVPKGEGAFVVRKVGRGRDLGGEVEILSGLERGETVVVEGAFLLKAEAEKALGAGAHAH